MNVSRLSVGSVWNFVASICVPICIVTGIAGCSLHNLGLAKEAATQAQAITQSVSPTGSVATQPYVVMGRPIAQAVGQAAGPIGETTLSLVAGLMGLIVAGITQYKSAIQNSRSKSAVAELHAGLTTVQQTNLTPQTKRVVAQSAS